MMKRTLALSALTIAFMQAAPAVAYQGGASSINPVGKYGGSTSKTDINLSSSSPAEWDPKWSEAFFKCVDNNKDVQEMFNKMSNGEVKDIGPGGKWCTNSDVFKPENTKLMQLAAFKLLAKPESNYDPEAMNSKSPNPPATGLFQIGPSDVEAYKCKTPDNKPMYTGQKYARGKKNDPRVEALKIPENNICCALAIAAARSKKENGNVYGDGKKGIMADFWEPMRVQNTKGAKGNQLASQLNEVCKTIGDDKRFFTAMEVETSRRMPASVTPDTQVAEAGASR